MHRISRERLPSAFLFAFFLCFCSPRSADRLRSSSVAVPAAERSRCTAAREGRRGRTSGRNAERLARGAVNPGPARVSVPGAGEIKKKKEKKRRAAVTSARSARRPRRADEASPSARGYRDKRTGCPRPLASLSERPGERGRTGSFVESTFFTLPGPRNCTRESQGTPARRCAGESRQDWPWREMQETVPGYEFRGSDRGELPGFDNRSGRAAPRAFLVSRYGCMFAAQLTVL